MWDFLTLFDFVAASKTSAETRTAKSNPDIERDSPTQEELDEVKANWRATCPQRPNDNGFWLGHLMGSEPTRQGQLRLEGAADSGIVSLSHVPTIALRKRWELRMKLKPYLIRSLN
jgi:hypothetical protein